MNEVYCPSCRSIIAASAETCPLCNAPTRARLRAQQSAVQQAPTGRPDMDLSHLDAHARDRFLRNRGFGQCQQCRSQNVVNIRVVEGGSQLWFGIHMVSALLWLFASGPISCLTFGPGGGFLLGLVPFFICLALAFIVRPKGLPGRECKYCGHRWRI